MRSTWLIEGSRVVGLVRPNLPQQASTVTAVYHIDPEPAVHDIDITLRPVSNASVVGRQDQCVASIISSDTIGRHEGCMRRPGLQTNRMEMTMARLCDSDALFEVSPCVD